MKMKNKISNQSEIEDTGELLAGSSSVRSKRMFILAAVAVILVAVIVALLWHNSAVDKKYNEQITISEKALVEGDYEQAEAGYIEAVSIKPKEVKPREGLAFTYALEEKYEESHEEYRALYDMTQDEKYTKAMEAVKDSRLPDDEELIPVEGLWLYADVDDLPDYESLSEFMFTFLTFHDFTYYLDKSGNNVEDFYYSCNDPENSYILPIVQFIAVTDLKTFYDDDPDPRNWVNQLNSVNYQRMDEGNVNKVLTDRFNVAEEQIPAIAEAAEGRRLMYAENGYYYQFVPPMGIMGVKFEPNSVKRSGCRYLIKYDARYDTQEGWDIQGDTYLGQYYLIAEYKDIDGEYIWTLHYNGKELPEDIPADVFETGQGNAPSDEEKTLACKAYSELLSRDSFDRYGFTRDGEEHSAYEQIWNTENCQFMIAYIDDDEIPELIIISGDADHTSGWGQIFKYENGRIITAAILSDPLGAREAIGEEEGYYYKSGYCMDLGMWQGYGRLEIFSINSGDDSIAYEYEPGDDMPIVVGYLSGTETITEEEFNAKKESMIGNAEFIPYEFHENTRENRNAILGGV